MFGHGRVRLGLTILAVVFTASSLWYALVEHFGAVEAVYQTVITISTVGFREVHTLDTSGRLFTMAVILVGVGTTLYTLTAVFEEMIENQIGRSGRRRMERRIRQLTGHVVGCGYGRIGRTIARLVGGPMGVLVVDVDAERAAAAERAGLVVVTGDATDDDVLQQAGLERAAILVAALPTDADNLYVVLSGRSMGPGLHIVARARSEASESKLLRAGADRVVNPQDIGARRMAAFALQPAVSDFLDVVMHGAGSVEYRLEQIAIPATSPLAGHSIRDAHIRDRSGALVLALRQVDDRFSTNPTPETVLAGGMTVIAIGTDEQLGRLRAYVTSGAAAPGLRGSTAGAPER